MGAKPDERAPDLTWLLDEALDSLQEARFWCEKDNEDGVALTESYLREALADLTEALQIAEARFANRNAKPS